MPPHHAREAHIALARGLVPGACADENDVTDCQGGRRISAGQRADRKFVRRGTLTWKSKKSS